VPLPTFDGEPVEHLHEHYDPDGNLTGTTVVTVPGWTADDRAWALGLALRESAECPRGHDLTESLDYDSWKWVPQPPAICFACAALEATVDKHKKDPHARSMLHSLHKVPRPKPKKRR
jgi:hypothetical protein